MIRAPILLGGRFAGVALLVGAAGASAQAQFELTPRFGPGSIGLMGSADPSAVVAAEIAFAKLARDKGQWTAFRDTADKDGIMFLPLATNAQRFLKGRKDPPKPIAWQPGRVFISCDGSYAVSTGPWQRPDGSTGTFITVWRQQEKGGYKWALDFGSTKAFGTNVAEEGIDAKIADCPARRAQGVSPTVAGETPAQADLREWSEGAGRHRRPKPPKYEVARIPDPAPASGAGQSRDGSLHWAWTSGEKARSLVIKMRYQGKDMTVIDERVEESS